MLFPVYLAHGALGPWDEVIFIGVGIIFIVMMGISWAISRAAEEKLPGSVKDNSPENPQQPDRFSLD